MKKYYAWLYETRGYPVDKWITQLWLTTSIRAAVDAQQKLKVKVFAADDLDKLYEAVRKEAKFGWQEYVRPTGGDVPMQQRFEVLEMQRELKRMSANFVEVD